MVDLEKEKDGSKSIAAKTISLLVTPEQAAKVMLASQMGNVNLVMRSPEDDQQAPNAQARPSELFGTTAKAERDKESLLESPDPSLNDKTKGFLDFLNSLKGKPADNGPPQTSAESTPRDTWTMRVLKPGKVVEEVTVRGGESEGGLDVAVRTVEGDRGRQSGATCLRPKPSRSRPSRRAQEPPAPAEPKRRQAEARNAKEQRKTDKA